VAGPHFRNRAGGPSTPSTPHPVAHNLEWADVIALFAKIGSVEHKTNDDTVLQVGAEHQSFRRSRGKDLLLDDVMAIRHFLTRVGQALQHSTETADFLVTIEHHEAKVYHLDLRADDPANHTMTPYDPHHFLHHLTQGPVEGAWPAGRRGSHILRAHLASRCRGCAARADCRCGAWQGTQRRGPSLHRVGQSASRRYLPAPGLRGRGRPLKPHATAASRPWTQGFVGQAGVTASCRNWPCAHT
jgi:hypothetical protein